MRYSLRAALFGAFALLASLVPSAVAAEPAPASASANSFLFAQTAVRGTAAPVAGRSGQWKVTFRGVPTRVLAFEDRPGRLAESISTSRMMTGFFGSDGTVRPNASLSLQVAKSKRPLLMAVELLDGRYYPKSQTARYRVRMLAQHGQSVSLPRRFSASSVFIDDFAAHHTCNVAVIGGYSYGAADGLPPLAQTGRDKYSHDDWGNEDWSRDLGLLNENDGPPARLSGGSYVTWSTESGFMRGCWNLGNFGDQYGSVSIRAADPYSGSNQYSCTATGNYVCSPPLMPRNGNGPNPFKVRLGGDDLTVVYMVCATNDDSCLNEMKFAPRA